MMKRRIFLCVGLIVLFLSFGLSRETFALETYKVKSGDTIAAIAKKFNLTHEALREANNLQGNKLRLNQVLNIPKKPTQKNAKAKKSPSPQLSSLTVKKGESIHSISKKTGVPVGEIKKINNLRTDSLKTGQKILLAKAEINKKKTAKTVNPPAEAADLEEEPDTDVDLAVDQPDDTLLAESDKDELSDAELLDKWHNPEERKLIVRVAQAFLGAPYRFGGASLKGFDCSSLMQKIYQIFDVSLPRTSREQAKTGVKVTRDHLIEGDLVFFNTRRPPIGHVGIYIGNDKFVHASSRKKGVKISSIEEPYYKNRFVKAIRLKGLAEEAI